MVRTDLPAVPARMVKTRRVDLRYPADLPLAMSAATSR